MSFVSALTTAISDAASAAADGDLTKDPEAIAELKRILQANAARLDDESFQDLHLGATAFGASATASELGLHHSLAHSIVADTIVGVAHDLVGFRDGVVEFDRAVNLADEDSAADLTRRRQGVEALADAAAYSEGDLRNQAARSEHLGREGGRD